MKSARWAGIVATVHKLLRPLILSICEARYQCYISTMYCLRNKSKLHSNFEVYIVFFGSYILEIFGILSTSFSRTLRKLIKLQEEA